MNVSAIIVAAGSGIRMGRNIPKQFIEINGKTILEYTLETFVHSNIFNEIIIVLSKDYLSIGENIINMHPGRKIKICTGGKERFHSVKNALQEINTDCDYILIHDSVRPFCSKKLLKHCLEEVVRNECAIPAISLKDSIREIGNDGISKVVDRSKLRSIQTPQAFNFEKLLIAYDLDFSITFTDDASVYEQSGNKIHLFNGEANNIKITTPEDLELAKLRLDNV